MTNTQEGMSLFEIVLSIGVLTLVLVGIVSLATTSVRNSTFSKEKTLSSKYAQEASEWLRSERDIDRTAFINRAGAVGVAVNYCLQTLVWSNPGVCSAGEVITDTPFKRDLTLTKKITATKTVIETDVIVSWTNSQGEHQARSVTYLSDWRER